MTTRLKMQNRILPKIDFGVEPVPIDFARDAEAHIDIYILKKTKDILYYLTVQKTRHHHRL